MKDWRTPLQKRREEVESQLRVGVAIDLHAIASGPIMDPNALYLPAGKVSLAEAEARERVGLTTEVAA